MTTDFSFTDDILDVRDLIERFEELEDAKEAFVDQITEWREEIKEEEDEEEKAKILKKIEDWGEWSDSEEGEEYIQLEKILDELRGGGGDEQWKGDWYPSTLINSDYFTEYTEDLVVDCGYINRKKGEHYLPWWIEVDWEKTAENVKIDYTTIDIGDQTYYYR